MPAPTTGAIDESLLNVPGFVNELTEYMMLSAHRPNRVLAFAKLAKRTGSCSYEMWTEALIMLGNIANGRFEAAEIDDATREMMLLVIEAQEQLWADMRVNA